MNKSELLRDLRALTQAGMKDCKDALEESDWDLTRAVDAVKAKGLANTSRNAGKITAEGVLITASNWSRVNAVSCMVEVNCQTDFVAKSPDFLAFAQRVANYLADSDVFSFTGTLPDDLELARKELMSTTKENVVVRRWFALETVGTNRTICTYSHPNLKMGTLVSFESPNVESPEFLDFAEAVVFQVAGMSPLAVSRDTLPVEEVARQRGIFETQMLELKNKPAAAMTKILEGKFNKWYSDVCLVDQESVIHPKQTIGDLARSVSTRLGGEVKILSFVRAVVGEGVEKKQDDLAQAVAEAIAGSK